MDLKEFQTEEDAKKFVKSLLEKIVYYHKKIASEKEAGDIDIYFDLMHTLTSICNVYVPPGKRYVDWLKER